MKKTFPLRISFLVYLFILGFNFANAQAAKTLPNSFVIHGKLSDEQLTFYTKSIEAADFEQYRLKTVSLILKFKNGFVLELLSAKDLMVKNKIQNIDYNGYPENVKAINYKYPLFEINKSGWITAEAVTATDTK